MCLVGSAVRTTRLKLRKRESRADKKIYAVAPTHCVTARKGEKRGEKGLK